MFVCYLLFIGLFSHVLGYPTEVNTIEEEVDFDVDAFPNKVVRNKTQEEMDEETQKGYWIKHATMTVQEKLLRRPNKNLAKNVILFLGDGMSIPTVAATRVYLGGEEEQLSFERFPYTGLSKTYCVDHQTADSACSATAYLGGVKANLGTIGVSAAVMKKNCTAMNDVENHVDSLARLFQLKGKKSGLVTTTKVTHASPAGVYAHTAYRNWESDTGVLKSGYNPEICTDIARQLVYGDTGSHLQVVLGGGRKKFLPKEAVDEEGVPGERSDHLDLIEAWKQQKEASGERYEYVWNRQQLLDVRNDTDYLLGLFSSSHMDYNVERDRTADPSLAEMTEAAIRVLSHGDDGFFLFVEGGRIDTAHHDTFAQKALDETAEFSLAVQKAIDATNAEDTLIVVTADHAHTMSYAGYAGRGSDIFGYAGEASDRNLYTILNYANGPGYRPVMETGERSVPTAEEMNQVEFKWPSTYPLQSETHGADDVGIYASGPWAHLFTGVMEENVLPHLMAFAACVSIELPCDSFKKEA